MTDLAVKVKSACLRVFPGTMDSVRVPIEPIDVHVFDREPASAVDPRAPLAEIGEGRVLASDCSRKKTEAVDIEGLTVVDANVVVRARRVASAGTAAAEKDADDAVDLRDSFAEYAKLSIVHRSKDATFSATAAEDLTTVRTTLPTGGCTTFDRPPLPIPSAARLARWGGGAL